MKKIFATVFLTSLLILLFPQEKTSNDQTGTAAYKEGERLLRKANQLFGRTDEDSTIQQLQDQLYRKALQNLSIAKKTAIDKKNDSLIFFTSVKIGLIYHYFDSSAFAKQNYLEAIRLKTKLPLIEDSFLFKPYLFAGAILYEEHRPDSALSYYEQAESVQNRYKFALEESQRLYNKLGAINYETGNYRLAKTYFEKALSSLPTNSRTYTPLMINYKINIASILIKLEQYGEAKEIYKSILPYKIYENEIWHNLGIIDSHEGNYGDAIADYRRVNYPASNKEIELDYNRAVAFYYLAQHDSAEAFLDKAVVENRKYNGDQKNTAFGLILKFRGDSKVSEAKYADALKEYQQAIIQFDFPYNDGDIYKNPSQFHGIFSYINLFNTLTSKGFAFKKSYEISRDIKDLEASLDAYRSAFRLVDYVGKTYESDDSRLFLNKVKYGEHAKPIDLCLDLYRQTKLKRYLEEAYYFDQQNKASVLSLNLQLQQIEKQGGEFADLVQKQTSLKSAITRLSLSAALATDNKLNATIGDLEIKLAGVQQTLNRNQKYQQLQPAQQIPSISDIQNKMLDDHTAILSYHLSERNLLILFVSKNDFDYAQQTIDEGFYKNIRLYLQDLHNVSGHDKYQGDEVSRNLYGSLVKPVRLWFKNCDRLIIIPDDELNYIPFESLRDENDHYLLESFSIQYQYSTAILNFGKQNENFLRPNILAFAPFIGDKMENGYPGLKYSKEEVSELTGKLFSGINATKQNFLIEANHYSIIHLATHASVNDSFPLRSFIAFYPSATDSSHRLYAGEIYDLRLDSTQLVVLSACETGSGNLVRGEGLMSLSRAFSYAGCPNIITSLWKAEDKTTAFLARRLHFHIQKGYVYDKALREAKLDLLKTDEIEPRYKTPNYWSHLVFIGNYRPETSHRDLWWVIVVTVLIALALLVFKRKIPRKAGPTLHR